MTLKGALNNIDINVIVEELKPLIINKHVKNFYELSDTKFILTFRSEGNRQLLIEVPLKIHLTEYFHEKPKFPPKFCVALRKYLRGRRVVNFYQAPHMDRIVVFEIQGGGDDVWKLVIEFFGKGNLILLKPDGNVQIAKRYMKLKNEIVLPNKPFTLPTQQFSDLFEISVEELSSILKGSDDPISKVVSMGFNINASYAGALCVISGVDVQKPASTLDNSEVDRLFSSILHLKEMLETRKFTPVIYYKDENCTERTSVEPFHFVKQSNICAKEFITFNKAVDEFFAADLPVPGSQPAVKKKKLSKNARILVAQEQQLIKQRERAVIFGANGNLLYQHYQPLSQLIEVVFKARKKGLSWSEIESRMEEGKKKGIESATLYHGYEPNQPFIKVYVDEKILRLDIRLSLTENINRYYYDKRKKALKKIPGVLKTIERMKGLVEKEKEKKQRESEMIKLPKKKRQLEWFEKYRWFFSTDGYLVIAGRDASSNEALVLKYMGKDDWFFHSEIAGAPVVIVKNSPGMDVSSIPVSTLTEAAIMGVSYSRSWKLGLNAGDIYHVKPDQVSKTPKSGEFLPKGSFVIRGEKEYFKNVRLELAVGIKMIEGAVNGESLSRDVDFGSINKMLDNLDENMERVKNIYPVIIGGPINVIKNQTKDFVVIRPARDGLTSGRCSSKIYSKFKEILKARFQKYIFPLRVEEIQKWIPSGQSALLSPE
ncbi:MAG: ribosome rescue protein RqcH [Promethearchaeota archaeon]